MRPCPFFQYSWRGCSLFIKQHERHQTLSGKPSSWYKPNFYSIALVFSFLSQRHDPESGSLRLPLNTACNNQSICYIQGSRSKSCPAFWTLRLATPIFWGLPLPRWMCLVPHQRFAASFLQQLLLIWLELLSLLRQISFLHRLHLQVWQTCPKPCSSRALRSCLVWTSLVLEQ